MDSNLKQLRTAAGLTQKQLAATTGLSVSTIGKLETGERDILRASMVTISLFCVALKCQPEDLVTET